jgi:hypothetical protein
MVEWMVGADVYGSRTGQWDLQSKGSSGRASTWFVQHYLELAKALAVA